ncbi:MAG: hypothetical protein QOH09_275 [Pseudonocardiales bacterium]|jgi:hypothetical protein|nr:hypothetical protein [Pseudonocardiales bacterium]
MGDIGGVNVKNRNSSSGPISGNLRSAPDPRP